jgi:hypothetical protein
MYLYLWNFKMNTLEILFSKNIYIYIYIYIYMKFAVITIGRSGSSELIKILSSKINIIPKPNNHLYPNELKKKYGKNIKVIFITRNIKDVVKSILQREKDRGINWILNYLAMNINPIIYKFNYIILIMK